MIAATIGLAGVVPASQAAVRVGKNYRLASDSSPYRGKDQVGLAVDPANPKHIVEVNANYVTQDCESTTSFDGGATWSDAVPLTPPATGMAADAFQPSCRISNHLAETMFQSVSFGSGQNVYATSITPKNSTVFAGEQGASTIVYKSTDGGKSWAPGVISMLGGPAAPNGATVATGPYYELPTLAVDPGAGAGGADRIYSVAHETTGNGNSNASCPACQSVRTSVSNDGGATFSPPVQASPPFVGIAGPDSASPPVIGPDRSVTLAWRTSGVAGTIQIARSTDNGASWNPPVTVTNVTGGGRTNSSHVTVLAAKGSSFPRLAGDKRNGNLYLVYGQGPPGPTAPAGGYQGADHFIDPESHVYFQRSVNGGASWSTPQLIDDISGHPGSRTIQTRHPSVTVAPNGRVDIVWEDRRHWYQGPGERNCVHTHIKCDDARLGDTYYAYSTNGGSSFSGDQRISDRSHNNDVGYDYRFGTGWAFGPQAVALGNDQLLVGWMDSREGSFDDDNQDIYLAKVDFNAPKAVPTTFVGYSPRRPVSLALANVGYPGGGEGLLSGTFATRNATKVVIVGQNDVPGALAGSVLARANLGPVLLSPAAGLPDKVKSEIDRLSPAGAYLIGDTGDLSNQVVADLTAAGVDPSTIVRIAGPDDAGTAANIAAQFDKRLPAEIAAGTPAFDAAVIANPTGPDAAAASALAAARRLPILYVSKDAVPAATTAALSSLKIDKTLVIGGPAQVSDTVMGALPSPTRLGGADQYATSKAVVAESLARGLPGNIVYAADGANPMVGALLGAAVGRATGIMMLVRNPLDRNVRRAAFGAGLRSVDRFVVVRPPAKCGRILRLVTRNASRVRSRTDTRVRVPCEGRLTASASARVRSGGKSRVIRPRTTVKVLSGRNRSIRVSLGSSVARELKAAGKLAIRVRARFVPARLSATSRPSSRTITVVVRSR